MGQHGVTPVLKLHQPLLLSLASLALSATLASAQPQDVARGEITLRGTVEAVDHAARTVRIRGEQGNLVTLDIPQSVARFDQVRVGDVITVTYVTRTEVIRMSVQWGTQAGGTTVTAVGTEAPAAAAAAQIDPDDFRHRLTVSVLWGVDNQFSGKMIQEATGQTTGGAPVNLNETSYDDVYGRMGFFKVGVGYRMSPRSEAVLNFVYSSSAANEVNVGTVGTPGADLFVQFDDFSYWGFEAGQRFFFARVRFTPYVGYLLGINRYGDIRGLFVNTGGVQPPGLVAQDGKFFEKSWAFSLGPTGGVLVGVGPIEVMAEVQLRFMGGLSDVDWLVEQGLRDINSESSRWSFPILFGARVRF
jgi:hypothetical protein